MVSRRPETSRARVIDPARSPAEGGAEELVDRFLRAYNEKDMTTIEAVLAHDVHMVHRERDVDVHGRLGVMRLLRDSAEGVFPDRRFEAERGRLVDGARVAVEHAWVATAEQDVPGFAGRGQEVRMELCTIFTVDAGQIVDYAEYG
jgi:ketosteroid isomerase-like protein